MSTQTLSYSIMELTWNEIVIELPITPNRAKLFNVTRLPKTETNVLTVQRRPGRLDQSISKGSKLSITLL